MQSKIDERETGWRRLQRGPGQRKNIYHLQALFKAVQIYTGLLVLKGKACLLDSVHY
jgi:hypothetical protein